MSDLVPLGRLVYRPRQLYLLARWRPSQGQLTDRIPLDHPFLDPFLKWWTKPTNVLQGRPIQCPPPQLAIYTDASTSGWGAHCGKQSAEGLWLATETARHHRVGAASHSKGCDLHFLPLIRGKVVMIHLDNSSAVAYLQNLRGHSLTAHVSPNMGNPLGVSAAGYHPVSEAHPRSSECSSRWPVEKRSDHRRGMVSASQHSTPDVLHFVHPRNGPVYNASQQQTDRVCVSSSRPSAVAVDALSISWDWRWVYAYPPTALMQ